MNTVVNGGATYMEESLINSNGGRDISAIDQNQQISAVHTKGSEIFFFAENIPLSKSLLKQFLKGVQK